MLTHRIYVLVVAERIPFRAVPLFGPKSGGTVIAIRYSFEALDVVTSEDVTVLLNNVPVPVDDIEIV